MNENVLGNRIKELRESKNYSQQGLGDKIGADQSTISRWEKGAVIPDDQTLARLADALGIDLSSMIEGVDTAMLNSKRDRKGTVICPNEDCPPAANARSYTQLDCMEVGDPAAWATFDNYDFRTRLSRLNEHGKVRKFCPYCGTGLIAMCPKCGAEPESGLESAQHFCTSCGHDFRPPRATPKPVDYNVDYAEEPPF